MHILATNDDGIFHPGLLAMVQELRQIGKVTIVAPDHNWSASGHVKTLRRPLRVKEMVLADGTKGFACDGAPSDCVALSALGLLPEPIDLVVSGINPNANLGHDVTYSGTVTAAMEAVIANIPAIAISQDSPEFAPEPLDYTTTAKVAAIVARKVWENKLPSNTLLNVNVPYCEIGADKRLYDHPPGAAHVSRYHCQARRSARAALLLDRRRCADRIWPKRERISAP